MMKIRIDGKELKGIVEKAVCNMDKKAGSPILRKVVLIDNGNDLKAYTTDMEGYLQISTRNYESMKSGIIGIDEEDLKVLLKMNGDVIITEIEDNILVQNGKKSISLCKYNISEFPDIPEATYTDVLQFSENEFHETINNLNTFTSDNKNDKMMQAIHFNINDSRVETLDGHRIGLRTIRDEEKIVDDGKICIHNMIVSDLKKTLDKKSKEPVTISTSDKYIKVSGKEFTYIQRRLEGEYFRVSQMLTSDYDFSFKADTQGMLSHMKYYTDNVIGKNDRKPVIFNISDDITTYGKNTRFEVSDTLEIKEHSGKDITIAFNPYFIVDALKVADADEVVITGVNPKAPIFITGNKYSFIVLPVNIEPETNERMEKYLRKVSAV